MPLGQLAVEQVAQKVGVTPSFGGGPLADAVQVRKRRGQPQLLQSLRGFGFIGDAHAATSSYWESGRAATSCSKVSCQGGTLGRAGSSATASFQKAATCSGSVIHEP